MPFTARDRSKYPVVIGCDEVGRGALSGPVVVAAVWFEPQVIPRKLLSALDDSKNLSVVKRLELTAQIRKNCVIAIAANSVAVIDALNIRNATLDAMRRAVVKLRIDAPIMIDGIDVPPGLTGNCTAVVRGDSIVPQIAAASIIAKTVRDGLMARLATRYPAYAWERNAGYGTKHHLGAIKDYGATAHHRRSYAPVAQYSFDFQATSEILVGGIKAIESA
ncbi:MULTISPECIES: ribonuclease HII [unclassified Rhizobium]|uniref:ribonuclease HII n=1 Tax=unclassified Rhizobium TaxID=2613769 RepID=UPI0009E9EC3A|nr:MULTISPECIES: ribonuclease HII [unclassified Rhizobium]MBP2463606.1 ribonuclease HII [Rhizobium sp. PvP014]MBP2531001.1 ribonuclease HII [Rhizobium sp. PvP099]